MSKTNRILALTVAVLIALNLATTAGAQQLKFQSAAPESCCVYSYWNAASENDPNSKNQAERLLAEPEVQRFIDNTIQRIGKIAPALMLDQPEAKQTLMRSIAPELTNKLFKNRGSFFIEEIKFGQKQQLENFKALLMVDAGADARTLAAELAQMFASDELVPVNATIPGHEFVKFSIYDEPKVELVLGATDGTLMIGFGEKTVADALQRISASKRPAWLNDFQSNKNATRVINFSHFNVAKIKDSLRASMDKEAKQRFAILEAYGFANVDSIETCVGFSEEQAFSRGFVRTDGEPEGIWALDSESGLTLDDVRHFPNDSLFAVGISKHIFGWLQILHSASAGRLEVSKRLYEIQNVTGINFTQLLGKTGDKWTIYNGAGDGLFSGMVLTGAVASGKELTSASIDEQIRKRVVWNAKNKDRASDFATISKRKVGSDEIYSFKSQSTWALQPSFSISGERVLFGLYPQAVESALKQIRQDDHEPLVDQAMLDKMSKSFAGAADTKLLGFAYVDAANQFSTAYPYVQLAIASAGSIVDQMSVPAESRSALKQLASGIHLPPARSIHQHLSPSYSMARTTEAGVEFETWQSIPTIDPGFAGPMAFAMLLPAVQQVRQNARKTVSMNHMRQMALACLNYESAHRAFPAGYTTNAEGEKLLSWRVMLLPFIEEGDLFNKFKLDEPWDSPNNKALIAEMPDVFRSPVSKAKKGMTVYRGVGENEQGGAGGILIAPRRPGRSEGIGLGSVTDGTSNTILFLETSDALAQEWTKPDEGLDCVNVDKKGVFGAYSGGTNVALADGSVAFLVNSVSQQQLVDLMQRNNGTIINHDEVFKGSNRYRRSRNRSQRKPATPVDPFFVIDNGEVELTIDNMLSQAERDELAQSGKRNDLKQIALAMLNFESNAKAFPAAYSTDPEGKPLLSWRVHILRFIDQRDLLDKFHLNEPWDSEHNKALLSEMPDVFNFADGKVAKGKTTVMAIGGPSGMVVPPAKNGDRKGTAMKEVVDGSTNTLLLVDAPDEMAVEWTKPVEFVPSEDEMKAMLARDFFAAFCDGSTAQIPKGFSIESFKAILTRDGGETVDKEALGVGR